MGHRNTEGVLRAALSVLASGRALVRQAPNTARVSPTRVSLTTAAASALNGRCSSCAMPTDTHTRLAPAGLMRALFARTRRMRGTFAPDTRPTRCAAFRRQSASAVLSRRDAGRVGSHYGVEPRVLRLRHASAIRHREVPGAIRIPLARLAEGSRCQRLAGIPTLPFAHDAMAAATRQVASLARTARRRFGDLRPRPLGRGARIRCKRRRTRDRGVSAFRRDRGWMRGARDPRRAETRSGRPPSRDAARGWPDERRGDLARDDHRFRRDGHRPRFLLRGRPVGARACKRRRRRGGLFAIRFLHVQPCKTH